MIRLIVDDNDVQLDPGTRIRVQYNSPLFDEENIPGSKTFWFDIPKMAANRKLFGFPEVPSITGKYQVYNNAVLYFASYKLLAGQLIVRKVKDKYRAALTTNVFGNEWGQKRLRGINFGGDVSMGSNTDEAVSSANDQVSYSYPNVNFNFPVIYNPSFYGEDQQDFLGYLNFYAYWDGTFVKNRTNWHDYREPIENYHPDDVAYNNLNTLAPQIYVHYLIDELLSEAGYTGHGNFLSDSRYKQLMLYCDYALDRINREYYVDASGPGYSGNTVTWSSYDVGSQFTFDGSTLTVKQGGDTRFRVKLDVSWTSHSSGITIQIKDVTNDEVLHEHALSQSEISDDALIEFSYTHLFNERTDIDDQIEIHILETDWTLNSGELDIINIEHNNLNRFALSFNLDQIVPNVTFATFLKQLRELMSMALYFDDFSKQVEFFLKKDIENTGYLDITDLVDPSTMEIEMSESKKYIISPDHQQVKDDSSYNVLGTYTNYSDLPAAEGSDLAIVEAQNNYYKVGENEQYGFQEWKLFSALDETVEYGSGSQESVKIEARIAQNTNLPEVRPQTPAAIIPKIDHRGRSPIYESKDQDGSDPLIFFWWHGMASGPSIDGNYPFASTGRYDAEGNSVQDFSLYLNSSDGRFEQIMKPWYEVKQSLQEKYRVELHGGATVKDIMELASVIALPQDESLSNKQRWLRMQSNNYLPEKADVEISMQGIETVRVKMKK